MKLNWTIGLSVLSALSIGAIVGFGEPAQAQYTVPGEDNPFPANEQDPNNAAPAGFDPMSLIHNANLSRSRSGAEFGEDTQRNLGDAAESFKQLQQQRLQELQQPAGNPEPAIVPAPDAEITP